MYWILCITSDECNAAQVMNHECWIFQYIVAKNLGMSLLYNDRNEQTHVTYRFQTFTLDLITDICNGHYIAAAMY